MTVRLGSIGGRGPIPTRVALCATRSGLLEAALHVELQFFVLSHLDLGRDAANLYRPRPSEPGWLPDARAGYDGLAAHGRALAAEDLAALRAESPERWRRALDASLPEVLRGWVPEAALDAADALRAPLDAVLDALYQPVGEAPNLHVLHAPSLGRHGRAARVRGGHRIAVDLTQPTAHALCQILHEACHAITDPPVRARLGDRPRSTRPDEPGFEVHQAYEAAAVAAGWLAFERGAPEWLDAYAAWVDRQEVRAAASHGTSPR